MSLDPTCAVDPSGRYRYTVEVTEEVAAAIADYDEKLRELASRSPMSRASSRSDFASRRWRSGRRPRPAIARRDADETDERRVG